ncbi:MAG: GNAT family N-acetyltransferase [Rhizobiaceae bacterium]|nr:GNAT family N-acetyltransferase [Rhizobiaceae bacterium]MCV0404679.1 GNAT family N-acetyltransferase [Rhizobiaceae bacterium]
MRPDTDPIGFRPVTSADLPMLGEWMERPHWREWWGDPPTELGYVRDMVEGRDTTRPFIFSAEGRDLGYIQAWRIGDTLHEPWISDSPWLLELPADAVGVDLSIADPDDLSKGIGTAALMSFVAMLRAEGAVTIIIDPDPANQRAVQAYSKAGFSPIPELEGRTGDSLIMKHDIRRTTR